MTRSLARRSRSAHCWGRYWRTPTDAEVANGEKRKKIQEKIWCEGEVVLVANGTTTTEKPENNARCKKLAEAGAVRIKWVVACGCGARGARDLYVVHPAGCRLRATQGPTLGLAPVG